MYVGKLFSPKVLEKEKEQKAWLDTRLDARNRSKAHMTHSMIARQSLSQDTRHSTVQGIVLEVQSVVYY